MVFKILSCRRHSMILWFLSCTLLSAMFCSILNRKKHHWLPQHHLQALLCHQRKQIRPGAHSLSTHRQTYFSKHVLFIQINYEDTLPQSLLGNREKAFPYLKRFTKSNSLQLTEYIPTTYVDVVFGFFSCFICVGSFLCETIK